MIDDMNNKRQILNWQGTVCSNLQGSKVSLESQIDFALIFFGERNKGILDSALRLGPQMLNAGW